MPVEPSQLPTRVRFKVLALAVCMASITYLDRVCISITAPDIMRDLSLSKLQMSFVFSAFTLAYGILEIPTGDSKLDVPCTGRQAWQATDIPLCGLCGWREHGNVFGWRQCSITRRRS